MFRQLQKNFLAKSWLSILLLFVLFVIGFRFRFIHPEFYPLGFDQVQILEQAEQIAHGHLVLLGPRTGPAPMFTGPLIYYVAAAFWHFIPSPYALVLTSLSLFTVAFFSFCILVYLYLDKNSERWLILALIAFSPFQVFLDRIPWNPNLTILAAGLVFFPLFGRLGKKLKWYDIAFVSIGVFLGYQAHFTGLLLLAVVGGAWLLFFRKQYRLFLFSIFGFLLSILPTVLFDLRHQYMNLRGLLFILQQRGTSNGPPPSFLALFIDNSRILLENLGKIVFYSAPYQMIFAVGVFFFLLFLSNRSFQKSQKQFLFFWIIFCTLCFSFYKGSRPEYYFLLFSPALFVIVEKGIASFAGSEHVSAAVLLGFGLYAITAVQAQLQKAPPLHLQNQIDATQKVRALQKETHSVVVYDVKDVDSMGMKYLLSDLASGSATTAAQTTHLIYPYNNDAPVTQKFGELAVWQDPRVDPNKIYLVRKKVIISTSPEITFLEDHYPQTTVKGADTQFAAFQNQQRVGTLYFLDDKQADQTHNELMELFSKQWDRAQKKWQPVQIFGVNYFVRPADGTTLLFTTVNSNWNTGDKVNFLEKVRLL